MSNPQSKSWVFTHNNWSQEDEQRYLDLEKNYLCLGKETGESGTPHLQGFIIFKRAYRLTQLKKLSPKAHWEKAVATDAMNYCMKEDYVIQDYRTKGKRTDIDDVRKQVEDGVPMYEIIKTASSYQAIKFAEKLKQYQPKRRNWKMQVTWIYGPTGSGKTQQAWELLGENAYVKPPGKWWLGYEGQEDVIIDDFRAHDMCFNEMLRVLDRYPHIVEIKGGHQQLLAKRVVVTSALPPNRVYAGLTSEDPTQLVRRVDFIIEKKNSEPSNKKS